jgi:AcrR family transcriptional regulator
LFGIQTSAPLAFPVPMPKPRTAKTAPPVNSTAPSASNALPGAQTQRFQAKREAILGAAATLFNQQGVKGTTLADIASSVGLVTNSVTYYYRKKEDLATACFLRAIEVFNAVVGKAALERTVQARLQSLLHQYAELLAGIETGQHPPMIIFSDLRALPSPQVDEVFHAYTEMFRHVRGLIQMPETAHWSRADANARTHMVMSVVHGLRGWIGRYEAEEYTRIADRVTDILMNGMQAKGSRWPTGHIEYDWHLEHATEGASEPFLRVATELVNEQGYRGASVDKISARLNVTKGSFYHHNDNKQDLISACFDRTFSVLRRGLSLAESSTGSGWDRACAATRALTCFQLSAQGPLLRITATSALPDQVQRNRVRRTMHSLTERMVSVIVDGMMDGSIRPLDPGVAAQIAVGVINAAVELPRWVQGVNENVVADLYVRPVFVGFLSH